MKICILVGSLTGGGAERVASILANNLYKNKYTVTMVNFEKRENEYYIDNKINRYFLGMNNSILKDLKLLNKFIKEIDADIYISIDVYLNILLGIAKKRNRIKVIMSERNNPRNVNIRKILKILRNLIYSIADAIVFQTEEAKNYFNKSVSKKGKVIINPIKPNLPQRNQNTENVIVAVGRLSKQKNYPLLLKVFKQFSDNHSDYKLVIFGEGEEENDIIELINKLNLYEKVFVKKFTNDLHNQIKNYKIYVLTSDYEGIPNSLIEAMGMGFPVIASDTPSGGTKCLINHGENGYLFKPGDSKSFYNFLTRLADNEELQMKFSTNAVCINDYLSEERIMNEWIDLIEQVLKR